MLVKFFFSCSFLANAWEQVKLGDICEGFDYGLNAPSKKYDGIHKYIRITDIDEESRKFLEDDITSPDISFRENNQYILQKRDILFARTGASVGKTYLYDETDGLVYYAGFLIKAKVREEYDELFVYQSTLTKSYKKYIKVISQRSGQPGVNANEYKEFYISIPIKEEQTQIGNFFQKFDELITLHRRKSFL